MTSFTAIGLSRLPPPQGFEPLDYEQTRARLLAAFREHCPGFDAMLESDPAVKLLEATARARAAAPAAGQ